MSSEMKSPFKNFYRHILYLYLVYTLIFLVSVSHLGFHHFEGTFTLFSISRLGQMFCGLALNIALCPVTKPQELQRWFYMESITFERSVFVPIRNVLQNIQGFLAFITLNVESVLLYFFYANHIKNESLITLCAIHTCLPVAVRCYRRKWILTCGEFYVCSNAFFNVTTFWRLFDSFMLQYIGEDCICCVLLRS